MWGAYHRLRTAPTFVSDWQAFLSTSIRDKVFPWRAFLHQVQGFPLASISFDLHQGQGFPYILPVCYPPYIQTANKDKVTQGTLLIGVSHMQNRMLCVMLRGMCCGS